LSDEMSAHLELSTADHVASGLSLEDARRAAELRFGGTLQTAEAYRDRQGFPLLDSLWQDVRYAVRTLRKNPAFTITAAATLALAIGASTVMFSVVNAVLLRPLPYRAPEQLAMLWTEDPTQNLREGRSALSDVEHWRSQSQSFADMATFDTVSTMLTGADGVEQIIGASISPNLLPFLDVRPILGRSFSTEEADERQRLVLISHRFWQARFGGSRDALGATIVLNGLPSQIVGILLKDVQKRLSEEELTLRLTDPASDFLVGHGFDEHFGARPLKRAIQRFIEDPLSEKILLGEFAKGDDIEVDISADKSKLDFRVLTSSTKA